MMNIVHIFIHLPKAVLIETCEGLASNFTIVQPTEAFLYSINVNFDEDAGLPPVINGVVSSIIVIWITEKKVIHAFFATEHYEIFLQ
jgi:hypothetical protein